MGQNLPEQVLNQEYALLNEAIDIRTQPLNDAVFSTRNITAAVLRLDEVHPVVSGNKLFKLHYFLQQALQSSHRHIVTFGGAYSNHLAATAFACRQNGLRCTGIVRGEAAPALSHTLLQCRALGMHLQFISRQAYARKEEADFLQQLTAQYGPHLLIPEGGCHPLGAAGAARIAQHIPAAAGYTHIATAMGTATTAAGLVLAAAGHKALVLGFSVLKGMQDTAERMAYLLEKPCPPEQFTAVHDYCFNGYAAKHPQVFSFMNRIWEEQRLPTDFVYTAKMLFGVYDLASKGFFAPGSRILCIHTGGLQGNLSLPVETLTFRNI